MKQYLLGIDCGTSIVKCCIMDEEGNELVVASRKIPIIVPQPNWAEEDMNDFWKGVTEIIPEALNKLGITGKQIAGIGVTGQGDGNWLIDKDGEPVQRAIIWTDGRAASILNDWINRGVVEEAFKKTGTGPYSGSANSILRWQIENNRDALDRAYLNLWSKDWIQFKLTGVPCGDASDISLMGIDIRNVCYDDEILDMYGLKEYKHLLPEIVDPTSIIGKVTAEAAKLTGLQEGTPVVKGVFDMVASTTGTGCVNPGEANTICGTTLGNLIVIPEPVLEPANVGMLPTHSIPGMWLKNMGVNYGMPNLEWFIRNLGYKYKIEAELKGVPIYTILEEALARTDVGANGIIYSPYLCPGGERVPFVKAEARGQFFGLTEEHTLDDMCRAVYEGMGLSMMDCYKNIPVAMKSLALCGGGAKSDVFAQILCDCAGAPVQIPEGTEFGAKGVGIIAGVAVGMFKDFDDAVAKCVKVKRRFEPNLGNTKKYNEIYKVYDQVRKAVMDSWDSLAAVRAKL